MNLEVIAKIVEAEASVLPYEGKIAIAQCVLDNEQNVSLFATPSESYSEESMRAAIDVFEKGVRRFPGKKLLQFRSFTKYSKNEKPDMEKIYQTMSNDLVYLGEDSLNEWGHYYFGKDDVTMKTSEFKLLLIAGHGDGDPGACGCGYQEANLTRELVGLTATKAKAKGILVTVADTTKNWFKYLKNGGTFDFTKYDYVLEIHFNSSVKKDFKGDGVKQGSMFFIHPLEKGWSVEQKILDNLYAIGSKKAWDGIVLSTANYDGGLLVQNKVKAQGVSQGVSHGLLETCFVSDRDDMNWYQSKKNEIASVIVDGIVDGFGLTDAKEVESFTSYKVKVDVSEIYDHCLNVREEADGNSKLIDTITEDMTLTIVDEATDSNGNKWGLLKAYQGNRNGWIRLDYAKKV